MFILILWHILIVNVYIQKCTCTISSISAWNHVNTQTMAVNNDAKYIKKLFPSTQKALLACCTICCCYPQCSIYTNYGLYDYCCPCENEQFKKSTQSLAGACSVQTIGNTFLLYGPIMCSWPCSVSVASSIMVPWISALTCVNVVPHAMAQYGPGGCCYSNIFNSHQIARTRPYINCFHCNLAKPKLIDKLKHKQELSNKIESAMQQIFLVDAIKIELNLTHLLLGNNKNNQNNDKRFENQTNDDNINNWISLKIAESFPTIETNVKSIKSRAWQTFAGVMTAYIEDSNMNSYDTILWNIVSNNKDDNTISMPFAMTNSIIQFQNSTNVLIITVNPFYIQLNPNYIQKAFESDIAIKSFGIGKFKQASLSISLLIDINIILDDSDGDSIVVNINDKFMKSNANLVLGNNYASKKKTTLDILPHEVICHFAEYLDQQSMIKLMNAYPQTKCQQAVAQTQALRLLHA